MDTHSATQVSTTRYLTLTCFTSRIPTRNHGLGDLRIFIPETRESRISVICRAEKITNNRIFFIFFSIPYSPVCSTDVWKTNEKYNWRVILTHLWIRIKTQRKKKKKKEKITNTYPTIVCAPTVNRRVRMLQYYIIIFQCLSHAYRVRLL